MTIKYTLDAWIDEINEIQIVGETETSFTEHRVGQSIATPAMEVTEWSEDILRLKSECILYNTWEDAKSANIARRLAAVEAARMQLKIAESELKYAKELKNEEIHV